MLLADVSHWKNHRRLHGPEKKNRLRGGEVEVVKWRAGAVLMAHFIALYC